ncbi:MAG: ABC transporter ATP-binding protein [Oscillospiraceae bacterium]|nr:ABC transporter ATP-binding protein [Oscillospiraceae bacterium]
MPTVGQKKEDILLDVKGLKTFFYTSNGTVRAVNDVDFYVRKGETLGLVGESGCGKSISSMSLARIVETPPGKFEGGEITLDGRCLMRINEDERFLISEKEMRSIRGNEISYIFQEPMTSLNPVFKISKQISEPMILHRGMSKKEAHKESIRLLELVKIPNPERIVNEYPFRLSGGMRQRVMIAMALACEPKLLIADEPTTALDVTVQAQVLDLMNELKERINTSIVFITHDLGVIAEMCDRVVVMYAGKVVESSPIEDLFSSPQHPYTQGLISSKPDLVTTEKRLNVIPGSVPDLTDLPPGCPFHPRCYKASERCKVEFPPSHRLTDEHLVSCWECKGEEIVSVSETTLEGGEPA